MSHWTQLRRLYNYKITTKQVRLVRQHSESLLSNAASVHTPPRPHPHSSHRRHASNSTYNASNPAHSIHPYSDDSGTIWSEGVLGEQQQQRVAVMTPPFRSVSFSSFQSTITHEGHDCNGYSLDSSRCQKPNKNEIRSITSMMDFDEAYSRRVLGFNSVEEMYKWVSCVRLLHKIKELPILITNALDDPLIIRKCHEIPEKYTSKPASIV